MSSSIANIKFKKFLEIYKVLAWPINNNFYPSFFTLINVITLRSVICCELLKVSNL